LTLLSRTVSGATAAYLAVLVLMGPSESAMLLVVVGIWLFCAYIAVQRSATHLFGLLTAAGAGIATMGVVVAAPVLSTAFADRILMYQAALAAISRSPVIGYGIGSSVVILDSLPEGIPRSIHNFLLHYWLEMGLAGVTAFLAILVTWWRQAALPSLNVSPRAVIPAAVFLGYLAVAFFQPPPVRRIWWLFFAMSYAAVLNGNVTPTKSENSQTQ